MSLLLRAVPAEVHVLSAQEKRLFVKRKFRDREYLMVKLPHVRGGYDLRGSYLLPVEEVSERSTEPHPLDTSTRLRKSYWLIGDEVFVLNDLDVTALDVFALRAEQLRKREAQLQRARAALEE